MFRLLASAHSMLLAAVPNPGSGTQPPGKVGADVTTILSWGAWVVFAMCVAGVLTVAGMMAVSHRRGEGGQHASGLMWVGGGCALGASAAAIVGALV